ncbi:MAG: hypothetical protein B7Z33_11520 [Sphingomonadales bacterium 12-68-11]|nr:MAG: hypothetical protein B7Z33_11520 [Sphingomonadales bacterium 12-68-11]
MKTLARLLAATALVSGTHAHAGEDPLYQPAPAWVAPAALPTNMAGPPIVLFDDQRRIEAGRLWSYTDRAIRIDNPQMLNSAGTIQASWLPDKGDLIVHGIAIVRDGQSIDVLAGGAKFDVLRRERQLEQRMIDGSRTATLAVPGLRVGDVLRLTYSVTNSDQALKQEVQAITALPSEPFDAGFARVRFSWPADTGVRWGATGGVAVPEPVVANGFATLELPLPLAKRPDVPEDAPVRYKLPPLLQAGTFADWPEVSRVMAPLFATEGTIAGDGPIARQVAAIEARHTGQLDRAVAALRVVQDEISYLLNGMEGGNYIPQTPAETWDKRYGDCKAKTMLLLAMLREMGIEAEAVVVASSTGDAVPAMLPMPAAFDHVIVRAVIDGTDYWLDGTSTGASLAVVGDVPEFHYALPLRPQGSELVPMAQRAQTNIDRTGKILFDHRAGLDVPSLYEAEWTLEGPAAAPFRSVIGQTREEQLDDMLQQYVRSIIGENLLIESAITFDEATNTATVKASGLMPSQWQWERGRGTRGFSLPTAGFQFRPDRSRAAWRDIPVALPGPYAEAVEMTVLLPEGEAGYALDGPEAIAQEIAGVRLNRSTQLSGDRLVIKDAVTWPGGEIAPAAISSERARAARIGSADLTLRAPAEVQRYFDVGDGGDRARLAPIEAAYATLIQRDPDNTDIYRQRAQFRSATLDRAGALADLGVVIERDPGAGAYVQRSNLLMEMGRLDEALADAETAWDLDPSLQSAFAKAAVLPYLGRIDEAIALLEEQSGDAAERRSIAMTLSDLDALSGRRDAGLQRLDDLLEQRPGDPDMLNAKCWYQGTWNVRREELPELCTEAVEKADFSPPVLDSRAMGYYRLGRYQDALKDLNAALSANPDQTPSLFMRGVVRREMGDREGAEDIRAALARQPSLERFYARFGIAAR